MVQTSRADSGNTIRFVMGGAVQEVTVTDPTQTVLDWLRGAPCRRVGTKEGCAEGDCGACTVMIGDLQADGGVAYRAVNACIQFLPMLDGKELVTVEDLAPAEAGAQPKLHPVQQAMVDRHASQCGFCTPGFVMSLYALYQQHETAPDRTAINDCLAGNLCRCTGYRPIVDAAQAMFTAPRQPHAAPVALLQAIQRAAPLSITTEDGRRFDAPRSLDALCDLAARFPDAVLLAGATDIGLWVTKQLHDPPHLISLAGVPELQRIEQTETALQFGAGVTYSAALPVLGALHPDLDGLLRRIGSTQIRNSGTLGGNIANASPIGDTMPALIALGATIELRGGVEGEVGSRTLPLEEFFLDYRKTARRPGEIVTRIILPYPDPDALFATYKVSKRVDQDISAVCGGFYVETRGGRISVARLAYGGMAGTPKRAAGAEAALLGRPFDLTSIAGAMQALEGDFTPLSDMRASAQYRMSVARNLLMRFYLETAADAHNGVGQEGVSQNGGAS